MPLIQTLQPWDSQPQEAVGVDWDNPITRGILVTFNNHAGSGLVDAAGSGEKLTQTANTDFAPTSHGDGFRTNAVSENARLANAPTRLRPSTQGSILWVGEFLGAANPGSLLFGINFAEFGDTAPYVSLCLKRGASGAQGDAMEFNADGSEIKTRSGTTPATTGSYMFLGRTRSGRQEVRRLGLDGSDYAASGTTSFASINYGSGPDICIGDPLTLEARNANAICALAVMWDRFLSDEEAAKIFANPWQLFAPLSLPMWIGAAAAAPSYYPRRRAQSNLLML